MGKVAAGRWHPTGVLPLPVLLRAVSLMPHWPAGTHPARLSQMVPSRPTLNGRLLQLGISTFLHHFINSSLA